VLSSVIASYNRALWPAQLFVTALAIAVLWLAARSRHDPSPLASCLPSVALAAAWAWTGAVFLARYMADIDFMAPVYAALFLLQALLLAWTGGLRGAAAPARHEGLVGLAAYALVTYAIIGYPMIAAIAGHGLPTARVVGLAPGPTATFTLGMLLLARRTPLHLTAVPLLWTLIGGATAWRLGVAEEVVLPLLGLGASALILWKNRRLGTR
jgi:hypothetical protein